MKKWTRLDIDYVREEFSKVGYELLTKGYYGTKQVLRYHCSGCDTIRQMCWNNFVRGTRCRICFLNNKNVGKGLKKIVLRNALYDMTQAAKMLGVRYSDLREHVKVLQTLPAPTREMPNRSKKYYNDQDIEQIERLIA